MADKRLPFDLLPTSVHKLYNIYQRQGGVEFAWRLGTKLFVDNEYSPPAVQGGGETLYRTLRKTDIERYEPTVDPYALYYFDPGEITRITGRVYPPWKGWRPRIGAVRGGDWDRQPSVEDLPRSTTYSGSDPQFYYRETFEDTPLHQALVDRFEHGVPWCEIDLIQEFISIADSESDTTVWNGCSSKEDVLERAAELDALFETIRTEGYQTQAALSGHDQRWFLRNLGHEIRVDISRTGEPLFVEGRHRLSIAKILELERIPALVSVRHKDWVQSVYGDQ